MDPRFVPDRAATERDRGGPPRGVGIVPGPGVDPVLPSRLDPISRCRSALRTGRGPVLLTGEAGSGKTWIWRRLADEGPDPSLGLARWLGLEASPSDLGPDLLRQALRGLGRADASTAPDPRSALVEELAEQSEEGRRWILVLDEAQNASDAVLEEFRLASNRLGRPEGFAGLLLVGRSGLAMRLRSRAWESLESRLAAGVRLGPIDAEEAGTLIRWSAPGRRWDEATVEQLHARASGNPARLIRLADRVAPPRIESTPAPEPTPNRAPTPTPRPAPAAQAGRTSRPAVSPEPTPATPTPRRPAAPKVSDAAPAVVVDRIEAEVEAEADGLVLGRSGSLRIEAASATPPAPRLVEARPPLRFEDGLIEVGWSDADADADPEEDGEAELDSDSESGGEMGIELGREIEGSLAGLDPRPARRRADDRPTWPTTEPIHDPYAAIQALSEWELALGSATDPGAGPSAGAGVVGTPGVPSPEDPRDEADRRPSQVRAEAGQEFAPYSRLFSQLNSASDAE
jgi:general secretion pathway protein A